MARSPTDRGDGSAPLPYELGWFDRTLRSFSRRLWARDLECKDQEIVDRNDRIMELRDKINDLECEKLDLRDSFHAALKVSDFAKTYACESGLSWSGFNIVGSRAAISEIQRLMNVDSWAKDAQRAISDRNAVAQRAKLAEEQMTNALVRLHKIEIAMQRLLDAQHAISEVARSDVSEKDASREIAEMEAAHDAGDAILKESRA